MINQAEITIKKTSDLVLWDKNPRQISDKNFIKLKKQIEKLGVYKPLLINQDNIVIGGNMRLRALMDLGVTEVACSNVKTKDETEMIEYALSDNDRAGDYDQQQLAELIYNVPIDLELYHIDVGKTYKLKDVLSQFTEDGEVPEAETDEDNIKSKKGEVYLLGEHRVMCGSSDDPADVAILMNGKKARMIFTDPPYMVDYKSPGGGSYNSGKYKHHDGKIFNDNLKEAEALEFYKKVAQNLYDFSTDDSCIYWWYASRNQHFNREALMGGGLAYKSDNHLGEEWTGVVKGTIISQGIRTLYGWLEERQDELQKQTGHKYKGHLESSDKRFCGVSGCMVSAQGQYGRLRTSNTKAYRFGSQRIKAFVSNWRFSFRFIWRQWINIGSLRAKQQGMLHNGIGPCVL